MDHPEYRSPTERVEVWLGATTLHIRFNNPARHNALSIDMWEAIPVLLGQAGQDSRVRLVVFSGAGDKAFVAGADISQFEDLRAAREAVTRYEKIAEAALQAIYNCDKPTLACIQGYCVGGGVNVAIGCDIRIASSDSTFFIPAARLGLGYRHSALKILVDLIGPGAAKDLFFTARRIGADEAKALGLISRVASREELPGLLADYTSALAANAPLTVHAAKVIVNELLKPKADFDSEKCQALIRGCFESEDYAEGRRAFMEKRAPVFTGK
jgi:enoyl-CoA hydratase/carnithine racemase